MPVYKREVSMKDYLFCKFFLLFALRLGVINIKASIITVETAIITGISSLSIEIPFSRVLIKQARNIADNIDRQAVIDSDNSTSYTNIGSLVKAHRPKVIPKDEVAKLLP
jgi:lantibiotic modifying enzyme